MKVFTTSRNHQPGTTFAPLLPDNVAYTRILVAADTIDEAEAALELLHIGTHAETLREATSSDAPAAAVRDHVAGGTRASVYLVYRVDLEGTAPQFHLCALSPRIKPLGRIRVVDTDQPDLVVQVVPAPATEDDPVPMPPSLEGPDPVAPQRPSLAHYLVNSADRRLDSALRDIQHQLDIITAAIERRRDSDDPRTKWGRCSSELRTLAGDLMVATNAAGQVEAYGEILKAEATQ